MTGWLLDRPRTNKDPVPVPPTKPYPCAKCPAVARLSKDEALPPGWRAVVKFSAGLKVTHTTYLCPEHA